MIRIGVTPCFMHPDPDRIVFGPKRLSYFENDMACYLSHLGIMPVMLLDVEDFLLEHYMKEMSGFIIQGGVDISPTSFGEEPIESGKYVSDVYRDQYELKVIDHAIRHRKPILGICRGCQLLNVYFGGTLYQDLQTQQSDALQHRDRDVYDKLTHTIELTAGGTLEKIYADDPRPLRVNSVHHQGIKDLGEDLRVEAICPEDGTIEAIACSDITKPFILGVQWHPEYSHTMGDTVMDPAPLIDTFYQFCNPVD